MQFVFDELVYNESLIEINVGTDDGFNRNRISARNYPALEAFAYSNKFVSLWGLKGVGMDGEGFATILRCLEKVSVHHQAVLDEIAENKDNDIIQLERDYAKPVGDNTALEYVLKAKRKYRKEPEVPVLTRLTIQSLNVASNEIHLSERLHLDLFKQAIVYSDLKELDLSCNKLGDEGIKVVAGAL